MTENQTNEAAEDDTSTSVFGPRLWVDKGWTARVIKNEDDEGWAVEMTLDGEPEPALVGPWTMGRDKKNPKPLDAAAFGTLVKTATEVLRRHEQHLHALYHKRITVNLEERVIEVMLDIVPDEDAPYAILSARNQRGEQLAEMRVEPAFVFNLRSASDWVENDFLRPSQ